MAAKKVRTSARCSLRRSYAFTRRIRSTPVMVAGNKERRNAEQRMRDGIPVGPGLLAQVRKIAEASGVPFLFGAPAR